MVEGGDGGGAKFGSNMARNILFLRHCHCAIIFYINAPATCATFFSSRQWRAKSGAGIKNWSLQQI